MIFDNSFPIYQQIVDSLKSKIISGEWAAGERIRPVRDLALEYKVNPNTMQKALALLEQEGLLYTERTSGRFVTNNPEQIQKKRGEALLAEITKFITRMNAMGYGENEIIAALQNFFKEGENEWTAKRTKLS